MKDEKNGAAAEPEVFPLDDATIEAVALYSQQARDAQIAVNAFLNMFAKRHNLPGNWRLAENGRELVKVPAPAPLTLT